MSDTDVTHIQFKGLDTFTLPVTSQYADPSNKYIIEHIDGLGPPEVQNVIVDGQYQSRTPANRQIVATIRLTPNWGAGETPKTLREKLYQLLSTGYDPKVQITPMNGKTPLMHTGAYVSNWDQDLFNKDSFVTITFDCTGPTFKAMAATAIPHASIDQNRPVIRNPGTAEVGFQFAIKFTDTMPFWFIRTAEDQSIGLEFTKNFNAGDILAVSTIPNQQYVHWNKHRGKVTNMMGILKNNSEWITLHPGMNHFVVPKANKWIWSSKLIFTPQFWGV